MGLQDPIFTLSKQDAAVRLYWRRLMSKKNKNKKRCGDCYWLISTYDGHFICADSDSKERIRKKDSFDCDNFQQDWNQSNN